MGRRGECSCPGDESRETMENIYCWRMKTRSGNGGEWKADETGMRGGMARSNFRIE